MKALRWTGINKIELADLPEPSCRFDEVLIRVRAAGICGTDLQVVSGRLRFVKPPLTQGHEFAGEVAAVGEGVGKLRIGDPVAVDPIVGCGMCEFCRQGKKQLCATGGELGTTIEGGGFAEYAAAPGRNVYPVPDSVSFAQAALVEPLTCVLSALDSADSPAGCSALVLGAGPAGLLFLQMMKLMGAGRVVSVDVRGERLGAALRLGADFTIDVSQQPLEAQIAPAFEGEAPDVVIEAAGHPECPRQAVELVKKGGTVILYGISGTPTPNVPADLIVTKDLHLCTGVGAAHKWQACINLIASDQIDVASLITHRFPLEEGPRAFKLATDPGEKAIKVILEP